MRAIFLVIVFVFSVSIFARGDKLEYEVLKDRADYLLKEAKACEVDSDCQVTTELSCPYGCYEAINKEYDLTTLKELIEGIRRHLVCETCIEEDVIASCQEKVCTKQNVK